MYMDFALMAADQIANQAAKWHYMSGGQVEVPLVIRCSVGAGKGYGGQHSQSLESLFTHIPGLWVVYPATPRTPRACSRARSGPTTRSCSWRARACTAPRAVVPEGDYTTPIGVAKVVRPGKDATIVAGARRWPTRSPRPTCSPSSRGVKAEVIDLRSLVPLDMETVLASVRKTGRCVVAAQAVLIGSFVNEIVARILAEAFDDLERRSARIGAAPGSAPGGEPREGVPAQRRRHRRRRGGARSRRGERGGAHDGPPDPDAQARPDDRGVHAHPVAGAVGDAVHRATCCSRSRPTRARWRSRRSTRASCSRRWSPRARRPR